MNKYLKAACASCAGLLFAIGSANAATVFDVRLSGDQEATPVVTDAYGAARLVLNDDGTELSMAISIFGLDFDQSTPDVNDDVTRMHIHRGVAGENGPIVFGLIAPDNDTDGDLQTFFHLLGGTVVSVWDGIEGNGTTLADELSNLFADGLYLNVHTVGNAGGELRGQIIAPAPIPVPATFLLLAPALALLRITRRR